MFILASASPYKKVMMEKTSIPFVCVPSEIDEERVITNPEALVRTLSREKAEKVAKQHPTATIIGIDSIGYFEGKILTKTSSEKAMAQLLDLSGKEHEAITGITIIKGEKQVQRVVKTRIRFRTLSQEEIRQYLATDKEVHRYCLGYDPEGRISAGFISSIEGSVNNLFSGFPIEVLPEMLEELDGADVQSRCV